MILRCISFRNQRASGQPSLRPPVQRRHDSGLSLLELLVVMAVIAIMSALLIPAVGNFGRANALTTAGNQVGAMLDLARQNSTSRNVMTAVVLLSDLGVAEDGRALLLLEFQPNTTEWKPIGKWEILPEGTIVAPQSTFISASPSRLPFANSAELPVKFREQGISAGQYAVRIFLPGGGLSTPDDPAGLSLVEGSRSPDDSTTFTRPEGATTANLYHLAIIGATGTTRIDRTTLNP